MSGQGDIPNPETWLRGPLLSGVVDPVLNQISLSWVVPASGYSQFLGYTVFRSDSDGEFVAVATGIQGTAYVDASLQSTHFYTYYVAPVWADGESAPSNQLTIQGLIIDLFTAAGTWTKRSGIKSAVVTVIGGGGGGASGACIDATKRVGGNCGMAGGISIATYAPTELPASVATTVGSGGAGGAQIVTAPNQISGQNPGAAGGTSTFGAFLTATGGSGGNTHLPVGGLGSTQNGPNTDSGSTAGDGAENDNGTVAAAVAGASATAAPGAGGGGATSAQFFQASQAASAGGSGQTALSPSTGGAPGAIQTPGSNGSPGADSVGGISGYAGGGGGGGGTTGASGAEVGNSGGVGGLYGGGGGGGASGYQLAGPPLQYQGAGGNGAPGVVAVLNYFWT